MKKLLLLGLCIAFIFASSCKKDDKKETTGTGTGSVTYNGVEYPLTKGVLELYGNLSKSVVYNAELFLFSSGIGYDYGLTGQGNYIHLNIYSSSETDLLAGTYTYSYSGEANTFDSGEFAIGVNNDDDTYDDKIYLGSGTLTIAKSGSTYEITLSGNEKSGISATYTGTLHLEDYYSYGKK